MSFKKRKKDGEVKDIEERVLLMVQQVPELESSVSTSTLIVLKDME
ncbi:hypothetical protein Tco_1101066, partial [Tanacetum coccineum]